MDCLSLRAASKAGGKNYKNLYMLFPFSAGFLYRCIGGMENLNWQKGTWYILS